MKSLVSSFMAFVLLILLIGVGGVSIYLFDRRPADFPSVHIHPQVLFFKLPSFDWSAPDSLKISSYKAGAAAQKRYDTAYCLDMNKYIRHQLDVQTDAVDQAHKKEVEVEKQTLRAQQEAVLARRKEAWTLAGIDHMKTSGNSCQRAEQVIRGVIK